MLNKFKKALGINVEESTTPQRAPDTGGISPLFAQFCLNRINNLTPACPIDADIEERIRRYNETKIYDYELASAIAMALSRYVEIISKEISDSCIDYAVEGVPDFSIFYVKQIVNREITEWIEYY